MLYDAARIDRRASFSPAGTDQGRERHTERRRRSRGAILAGTLLPVLFIAAGLLLAPPGRQDPAAPAGPVGGTCASCHARAGLWEGSPRPRHAADESTVLGDFDDTTFEKDSVTTTFFTPDGDNIRTDGADGASGLQFAVHLRREPTSSACALPGNRLQAHRPGTRPRRRRQRWFHLYRAVIPVGDELH
jgi:hypothetical protein